MGALLRGLEKRATQSAWSARAINEKPPLRRFSLDISLCRQSTKLHPNSRGLGGRSFGCLDGFLRHLGRFALTNLLTTDQDLLLGQ